MTVSISRSPEEVRELPLVELAFEILKARKEPFYFRDLMNEIKQLRSMTDEGVMDVIARLYTEINVDGRFVCIGQNVWGLKRWYPVDKVNDKTPTSKKFVRGSGDAFSDDEEDLLDDYDEDADADDVADDLEDLSLVDSDSNDEDFEEEEVEADEEDSDFDDSDEDSEDELEEFVEEDVDEDEED